MRPRNRLAIVVAAIFLALAAPVTAAPLSHAPVAGTTLSIDELYQSPSPAGTAPQGYAWSSDGQRVLFLWDDGGRDQRDVWAYTVATKQKTRLTFLGRDTAAAVSEAVDIGAGRIAYVTAGALYIQGADGTPIRVESDQRTIRQLAVSPDGSQLAFLADLPDADGKRPARGGILRNRMTNDAADNASRSLAGADDPRIDIKDFRWSADSRAIVFDQADDRLMPERDIAYYAKGALHTDRVARAFPGDETTRDTIAIVDIASAKPRFFELPNAPNLIWNYGLSPDGRRLFINSSDALAKRHEVYVYDVASGRRTLFHALTDPLHVRPDWQVAWAPGDDGLLILTDRDGAMQLYKQKSAGAPLQPLTSGTWEIASFNVDAAHKRIYFVANKAALPERQIYRIPAAGGPIERVSPTVPGTHEPVFSPQFRYAASAFSNDATPPELLLVDLEAPQNTATVTRSPTDIFYKQVWARVEYMQFPSHIDGANLVARVSLPANYDPAKRYPLIVGSVYADSVRNQWGGRRAHPTWGLDQYLVAQGYIVLNVNVRGSWGQGRDHSAKLHHNYGETDINDLESGVRHVVAKGYVDPKRVGIWGSSYGGLMTLMSLAKKPGVYAVGIAGAPATNVWHAYPSEMLVMGPPDGPDMPGRYAAQSALYQSKGIRDPLMIIHGSRDPVVLYSDTIAFTERLIAGGQPFELVTLPGGSHGWDNDNLAQTRFAFKKMVDFFGRYLHPEYVK
jgi:dipeptidyl-peptidase-4